jgi:hypothetical protein
VIALIAMFMPSIDVPTLDFSDSLVTEGVAVCRHTKSGYGTRGDYIVSSVRYYGAYTRLDGFSMGSCNKDADGEVVKIRYALEIGGAWRRLTIGVWRVKDGQYLEAMTPARRMGSIRSEFGVSVEGLILRLIVLILVLTLFLFNPKRSKIGVTS